MPFVPVPNAARVELRMVYQEQHVMNTLWFDHGNVAPNADDLEVLNDLVYIWWVENMKPITSTSVAIREVYSLVQDGSGVEWTSVPDDPLESQGSDGGELLPNNVVLCVSFRTGLAGRSYRGRNFPPGITRTHQAGNFATPTYTNQLQAAYTALITAVGESAWVWGVATRYSNKLPRIEGAMTPITAVVVTDRALDSQRRRLVGRGT